MGCDDLSYLNLIKRQIFIISSPAMVSWLKDANLSVPYIELGLGCLRMSTIMSVNLCDCFTEVFKDLVWQGVKLNFLYMF